MQVKCIITGENCMTACIPPRPRTSSYSLLICRSTVDLQEGVRHYCISLQESDTFLFHCIFRLTTLWFRVMQEPNMDLLKDVPEIKNIKNYQWYTVLQQLITVAQHPCETLRSQVSQIVKMVLHQYTEHVAWQIIGMLNVSNCKKEFMISV